jgi:hypothetical protein
MTFELNDVEICLNENLLRIPEVASEIPGAGIAPGPVSVGG